MKDHLKIARFIGACLPLLFLVATVSGQDVSGLRDSLNSQSIPVTNILLENGDVLITIDYTMDLKEAMDHLEFALPSILKQAASMFPDTSLIRLEASVGGEKTGAFEIAASDALEGARGKISNDEMMSRLRGKPLVDIAGRLGQPERAGAPPSTETSPSTNAPPPSEDFFSKYFPSAEKPGPPPSSSPREGDEGSVVHAQKPARLLFWIGILIGGIVALWVGRSLARRQRRSSKNQGPR